MGRSGWGPAIDRRWPLGRSRLFVVVRVGGFLAGAGQGGDLRHQERPDTVLGLDLALHDEHVSWVDLALWAAGLFWIAAPALGVSAPVVGVGAAVTAIIAWDWLMWSLQEQEVQNGQLDLNTCQCNNYT